MKRYVSYVGVLLLAGLLVSCGGGGGGGGGSPSGTSPTSPTTTTPPPTPAAAAKPGRFEETDATVTLSPGDWVEADSRFGWSGGRAM